MRKYPIFILTVLVILIPLILPLFGEREKVTVTSKMIIDLPSVVKVLFHPRREMPFESSTQAREVRIFVESDLSLGGRLYVANPDAPVILFWHGNGEIAADYEQIAQQYTKMGINFFVVDFRGYGISDDTPTGSTLLADGVVVFNKMQSVLDKNNIRSKQWYVMGRSLGSATAIEIAHQAGNQSKYLMGLIVESGFAFTIPLLERLGGLSLEADERQGFNNHAKMATITIPTLIIHGEDDHLIPFSDGKALYANSGANKKRMMSIKGAGHNDLMIVGQADYFKSIQTFVLGGE